MANPLEQLDAMRTVPANWDGYGGLPPTPEAIDAAREFYRYAVALPGLPETYLCPTPNGGVHLEWDAGPLHLEVAFEPTPAGQLTLEFLYTDDRTGASVEGKAKPAGAAVAVPLPVRQIVSGFVSAAA